MAKMSLPEISTATLELLRKAGLNPFAVDLLAESYAPAERPAPTECVVFTWRGVTIALMPWREDEHAERVRLAREMEMAVHEVGAFERALHCGSLLAQAIAFGITLGARKEQQGQQP